VTHEERFEKAKVALQAAIPQDEQCAVLLIVASSDGQVSVTSNISNECKIVLMRDAIHMYEQMEREAPKVVR
jgi:hypothetical protein